MKKSAWRTPSGIVTDGAFNLCWLSASAFVAGSIAAFEDGGIMWGAIAVGVIAFAVVTIVKLVQGHAERMQKAAFDHELTKQQLGNQ